LSGLLRQGLNGNTAENAEMVIEALRSGRRPGSAARLVNACRETLYHWRRENAAFAAAWDGAVAEATAKIEEVAYSLDLSGPDRGNSVFSPTHFE
jgi:hypothetical protein